MNNSFTFLFFPDQDLYFTKDIRLVIFISFFIQSVRHTVRYTLSLDTPYASVWTLEFVFISFFSSLLFQVKSALRFPRRSLEQLDIGQSCRQMKRMRSTDSSRPSSSRSHSKNQRTPNQRSDCHPQILTACLFLLTSSTPSLQTLIFVIFMGGQEFLGGDSRSIVYSTPHKRLIHHLGT